jgi:hypothetical protein
MKPIIPKIDAKKSDPIGKRRIPRKMWEKVVSIIYQYVGR